MYKCEGYQSLVEFHLESNVSAQLNIVVNKFGNLRVLKLDEETGKPLANTTIRFEYNNIVKDIVTGTDGFAEVVDVPENIEVTITEVTAPHGYVNKGEIQKVVIKPNQTIEVRLTNKLHKNTFSLKKVNEQATLVEGGGYTFTDTNGTDAVFTLVADQGKLHQEVMVSDNSLATFTDIPVGTFFLNEKRASNDDYVLSPVTYRVESTISGITIFDENDTIIATQDASNPPTLLFEVKNYLAKGKVQLKKTDVATGQALPNTGIRILDASHITIFEGRTNQEGIFEFTDLPKGIYYLQEFDAPQGYLLNDDLHQFEIKDDGEVIKCEMANERKPVPPLPKTGIGSPTSMTIASSLISLGITLLALLSFKKRESK